MVRRRDDRDRPVYMIGIAAALSGMHPQTLRIYERRRLVRPKRSSGNTRLYSEADIERLRFIQSLTQDEGINLAGVERIIELQDEMERLRAEAERLQACVRETERRLGEETERVRRSFRADIVLVKHGGLTPWERGFGERGRP